MNVADFYAGKDLFMTGASGFMGKVLIEKLLWSCENIGNIYILIRPKKGMTVNERVNEMLKLPIFDRLKSKNPESLSKIIPISGDVNEIGLGINIEDRELLENSVSVIIHAASSVRFDDPVKKAVIINVRGTRDVMELAKNMKKIEVMTYISTTYCNSINYVIEEKVMKSNYDWKILIKLVENVDEHILNMIQPKIIEKRPNTYTFAKSLAENVVQDYSATIPCIIVRPSIVTYSLEEPLPGWVDNLNGPIGLSAAALSGLIHVVYGNINLMNDYMPCDYATNGVILATYYKGTTNNKNCEVMNGASGAKLMVNLNDFKHALNESINSYPLKKLVWYPTVKITPSKLTYYTFLFLTHIIPGMLIDLILCIRGINFSLLKIYRKVHLANQALSYFILNEWKILTNNYYNMEQFISKVDLQTFKYNPNVFNKKESIKMGAMVVKKYIFKDDMSESAISVARKQMKMRYVFHQIMKFVFFTLLLGIIISVIKYLFLQGSK